MPEMKLQRVAEDATPRQKAKAARLQAIADNNTVKTVQVWPASEALGRVLKHPNGTRFRGDATQPVDWPYDSFTYRRVRAGDVLLGGPAAAQRAAPDATKSYREQAAARRPKEEDVPQVKPISEEKQPQPVQQPMVSAAEGTASGQSQ